MKNVSVIGIGVVCSCGNNVENVWNVLSGKLPREEGEKMQYTSVLPPIKKRRANRYADMALYTASSAVDDANLDLDKVDSASIGTIYTTGYGPMKSNLKFCSSVKDGEPDLCSPTVFTNTVSNACVGQICIALNCKGVSTMIMGSNSIGYSQMLINKRNAKYILSGSIEEYSPELYDSFKGNECSCLADVKEGAVTILLKEQKEDENEDKYCNLIDFCECSLGVYPLVNKVDENFAKKQIVESITNLIKSSNQKIDAVFTGNNGSYFDEIENEAITEIFNNKSDVIIVNSVKRMIGETLGSAFNMNIMVAALSLRYGEIPKMLCDKKNKVNTVLVTGYDVTGNYIGYILGNNN